MSIYVYNSRVCYDDIDRQMHLTLRGAMGHMQEAAILHSSLCGYSIGDIERTRVLWMLVQWRARLVGTACWNDDLTVNTWPRTMERLTSVRNFEIFGQDHQLVAVGESNWVLVSADTGRPTRITPEVAAAYDLSDRDVFDTSLPKLSKEYGILASKFVVGRRDLDTNCHVNNRVYLDYALEALPDELSAEHFPEVSVRYHQQLLHGDPVQCWYRKQGTCHIVDICGEERARVHATVVFYET